MRIVCRLANGLLSSSTDLLQWSMTGASPWAPTPRSRTGEAPGHGHVPQWHTSRPGRWYRVDGAVALAHASDSGQAGRGQRTNGTSLMAGRHSLRGSFQSEAVVVCGDHFPTCLETTLIWSLTGLGSETPWTLGKE